MRRPTHRRVRRRGSAYVMILGVSLVLAVIGLAAVTVTRINARTVRADNHWAEAQVLAFSAAEHALARIGETSGWRTAFAGTETKVAFGGGTMSWRLLDEADGDLGDDPAEPFVILASGAVGEAEFAVRVQCRIVGEALEVLRTCLHAAGRIDLAPHAEVQALGGPVSTNGALELANDSHIAGDVEADSVTGKGTIDGTVTAPAPPKAMPDASVFQTYRDLATSLGPRTVLDNVLLSRWVSDYGSSHPDGVYFIDAPGRSVIVRDTVVYGTLVVRCSKLTLDGRVLMMNARKDYPVLVVDGDLVVSVDGWERDRPVPWTGPDPSPWDALPDGAGERFYDDLRGLVHVQGDVDVRRTTRTYGALLAGGKITCGASARVRLDTDLSEHPPMGYTTGAGTVVCGGWSQVVR